MSMYDSSFHPADSNLVLRDDQAEFHAVLDEVRACRRRGVRLRLIDGGTLSVLELERLAAAGADLFTSDKTGRSPDDLFILNKAARKVGGTVAHFHYGSLEESAESAFSMNALRAAVRDGVVLFLSNKAAARRTTDLVVLAEEARSAGSRLGYYHHGPIDPGFQELARRGAWIHVNPSPEEESELAAGLMSLAETAAAAGGGLVVHLDRAFSEAACVDLLESGAYLLFRTPPSDYRSPLRSIEERAARRRLDPRASYLYSEFMR
ncbi:MAG: hypothetical protein JW843_08015 [Candidatus Aminicenantes bacterium]|nr:hypothetical protein [Candidatus Aminicenantes bacterium]